MQDADRHPDLIRRKAEAWSEHVHDFLVYLEREGFDGSPRSLGLADDGTEAVTWVDGWASGIPFDGPLVEPDGMESVGRLLRRFHDVSAGYRPKPNAIWATGVIPMQAGDVIRHGDISATNIVWNYGEATALIDWEFAHPGPPIDDLALAAWLLGPMVPRPQQIEAGFPTGAPLRRRLDALLVGYDRFTLLEVLDAYGELLGSEYERRKKLGAAGVEPWAGYVKNGQLNQIEETARWFNARGRSRILR